MVSTGRLERLALRGWQGKTPFYDCWPFGLSLGRASDSVGDRVENRLRYSFIVPILTIFPKRDGAYLLTNELWGRPFAERHTPMRSF